MRKRYQTGGVRKQRGRWSGFWRVEGCRKSKVLGFVKDMTKSDAGEAVEKSSLQKMPRFGETVHGTLANLSVKYSLRTTVESGKSLQKEPP